MQKSIVDPSLLPTQESFIELKQAEIAIRREYEAYNDLIGYELFNQLKSFDKEKRLTLKNIISEILVKQRNIRGHGESWVLMAMQDILSNRGRRWHHLYRLTTENLKVLDDNLQFIDSWNIQIPDAYSRTDVLADAKSLSQHLKNGGKLRIAGLIRPANVKKVWYLVNEVVINGTPCANCEALDSLIQFLEVNQCLELLWNEWAPYVQKTQGSRTTQLMDLKDSYESLSAIIELYELIENVRELYKEDLEEPRWHDQQSVERFRRTIDAVNVEDKLKETTSNLDDLKDTLHNALLSANSHPIVEEIYKAVAERDEVKYTKTYEKLKYFVESKEKILRRKVLLQKFQNALQPFAEELMLHPSLAQWDEYFSHFGESWRWAQAKTWLIEYIDKLNEKEIFLDLGDVERRIGSATAELAAQMSWRHCLRKLTNEEEQHLKAWTYAIRKIGKGTGKHAEKYRREARSHMEKCSSAIPAWIMPLYRVTETIMSKPNVFDVVIIDEASQSGPDALLLQFLTKKIVVVGDPEQISPPSVGINRDEVYRLQKEHINDLPHKDAMGPEDSFFDLANILFSTPIVLREHFRCMPEIIQFSNNLCYISTPLIPLRQYPPKRLEPVKTVYVANGYRSGGKTTPVNIPEAEAIVKKINECCNDPDYDGKTMGVITLLGGFHQARLIDRMLLSEIGVEEIDKRNIVCGDAYAFQGDERDIIFLSMVAAADGEISLTALTSRQHIQRFNVAASRAKDQMWLFHTPTLNDFRNLECLRYLLLTYCLEPRNAQSPIEALNELRTPDERRGDPPEPFDSWFEVDVCLQILNHGYHVVPQFEIAGYRIDLLVQGMTRSLCVECDGDQWHSDPESKEDDMRRQRILERCGRIFWRISGSEFYLDQDKAMLSLWKKLEEMGIALGGRDEDDRRATDTTSENESTPEQTDESEDAVVNEEIFDMGNISSQENGQRERLDFSRQELEEAIISVLRKCPNNSCTKKSLTAKVCKYLAIITRGEPRRKFEIRIFAVLEDLILENIIEEYKATNLRIRLIQNHGNSF